MYIDSLFYSNCFPLEVMRFCYDILLYCSLQTCLHAFPLLICRRRDVVKFIKRLSTLLYAVHCTRTEFCSLGFVIDFYPHIT